MEVITGKAHQLVEYLHYFLGVVARPPVVYPYPMLAQEVILVRLAIVDLIYLRLDPSAGALAACLRVLEDTVLHYLQRALIHEPHYLVALLEREGADSFEHLLYVQKQVLGRVVLGLLISEAALAEVVEADRSDDLNEVNKPISDRIQQRVDVLREITLYQHLKVFTLEGQPDSLVPGVEA